MKAFLWGGPFYLATFEDVDAGLTAIILGVYDDDKEARIAVRLLQSGFTPTVGTPTAHYRRVSVVEDGEDEEGLFILQGLAGDWDKLEE